MPRKLLLFDVDGTLLLTGGAGMRAMAAATAELFGSTFSWAGIDPAGGLDPDLFAQAVRHNAIADDPAHEPRFQKLYLEKLPAELHARRAQVRAMPGVRELIDALDRRAKTSGDVVLGLLTGNYSRAVPLKLAAIGLDVGSFTITACGEHGPTRADLVRCALESYRRQFALPIDPRHVVVIGDTPRDVACAKAHGCIAFAVATGRHTVQQLSQAGADHVVADLSDPSPLLALLDNHAAAEN